jgi:epoxyqueuosine reductase
VCPYNASQRNRPRGWPEFEPRHGTRLDLLEVIQLDQASFSDRFRGSPIKRAKRRGLVRNAALALGSTGGPGARAALETAAERDPEPMVRDAAEWSLRRLP